jgi:multicomponent Na+:H+ antiporter subunit B
MGQYRTMQKRNVQQRHRVVQVITKFLIPMILLFAFYVQFHGDFGPGGGFQAGVIFASAFILHGLIFGEARTRLVVTPNALRITMSLGLLLYAGTGVLSLLLGGNYLDYSVLLNNPISGQHWGIFTVELGVGITVAAVMISLFYCFSSKRDFAGEIAFPISDNELNRDD